MGKALWDEELGMIVFGQLYGHMLAISRGAFANIHCYIKYSTLYAAYQLTLGKWRALEVQASHHAITAHRLVVLAEVYTMTQDWRDLLFKLSLAETLEEVATRVAEEAWLYNEDAIYISFDYIHCSNLNSYIRFFRITPSLFSQRGLHFLPKPLFLRKRGCNRPPVLRTATLYGWRGIKTLAMLCGMGPPCFSLLIGTARIVPHCSIALHWSSFE